jgi:hypothetical protein
VESVADAVRVGGYDVVFGAGEAELLALSRARDGLGAVLPHGAHESVLRALDTAELSRAATEVGIAVPEEIDVGAVPDEATPVVAGTAVYGLRARHSVLGAGDPGPALARLLGPSRAPTTVTGDVEAARASDVMSAASSRTSSKKSIAWQ